MKLLPRISARALLLLFLATALISGYFAVDLRESLNDSQAQLATLEKSVAKTQKTRERLDRALMADAEGAQAPVDLAERVGIFNTRAQASRVNYGVNITSVAGAVDVMAAADTLPGTQVKSARLVYRGTYASYDGLLAWLESLRGMGAAISGMKAKGTEFEVAVRLYGTGRAING